MEKITVFFASPTTAQPCRRAVCRSILLAACLLALWAAFGCAQKEASEGNSSNSGEATATRPETGTASGETAGTPPAPEGVMKVALITPGPVSDKGWNASANEGLQRIKTELGAEVSPPVEGPGLAQVEGVLRDLAQQGNHLIFAHGSEYDDAAKKIAPEFPKTTFVVMGGRSSAGNVTPIRFAAGQATYLAGVVAARMSKTGKIGLVGATKIPIIEEAFASFEKGAKAARPDITVTTVYTGDEKDIAKARQQAQALLDAGADVLMHNANAGGQGVAQAVMDKNGAMFIGANADQSDLATPKNIGSFILDVPSAMVAVAKQVKEGKGNGKPFPAGLADKAVSFQFNPKFQGQIPAAVKAEMQKAEQGLIAGTINPKSGSGSDTAAE